MLLITSAAENVGKTAIITKNRIIFSRFAMVLSAGARPPAAQQKEAG